MGTVRERRRAESKAKQRKERPKVLAKAAVKPVIAILLVAGISAGIYAAVEAQPDCPGHWHATQGIFIDGERVSFAQPPYNHQGEGGKLPGFMHMHDGNQEQLHFEPATTRCQGIQETMKLMDIDIEPGVLALGGAHLSGPHGGFYEDIGNRTVRVFIQASGDALREAVISDILEYQLMDGERMMITYGTYSDADLVVMMDSIGWPPGFDPSR